MKYVSINSDDVKKMFKICGACLDTSGVFDASQYIKIEVRGNKATAIGCDGVRLATVTSTNVITSDEAEFDFFVKPVKFDKRATHIDFTINDDWKTVNVYRLFAGFKEETVIDTINEYWQIELAELEV